MSDTAPVYIVERITGTTAQDVILRTTSWSDAETAHKLAAGNLSNRYALRGVDGVLVRGDHVYLACAESEVPADMIWHTSRNTAGQHVEIEYADPGSPHAVADRGSPWRRKIDRGVAVGEVGRTTYYRHVGKRQPAKMIRWTTWGSVRGQGPIRETRAEAERDYDDDARGCARQGGYSDRAVYGIDEDGWVVDDQGGNVWPHGRTSRALKVDIDAEADS